MLVINVAYMVVFVTVLSQVRVAGAAGNRGVTIADRGGELQLQNDPKQPLKQKVMLDHHFKGTCKKKSN